MIQSRSTLLLKRLSIHSSSGTQVYDEPYHHGVNIIRGENSSGKSTIANFIFYVLGGDFNSWTSQASMCHEVRAELELSGALITVKRIVSEQGQQPLYIYWGGHDDSILPEATWQVFPYKQTVNSLSFTNVLFNTMRIPEVKTEDSNITMHQLLRLMYIDQDTPTQNLFRLERFDLPITRQAVAEVLLGIYDDSLYQNRLDLRVAMKKQDEKKQEYDGVIRVFKEIGTENFALKINKEIGLANAEAVRLDTAINEMRQKTSVRVTKKSELNVEARQQEFLRIKNQLRLVSDSWNSLQLDISDSELFLTTLRKRIKELQTSSITRKVFGELPLTHCPQCLAPLESPEDHNACVLCKNELPVNVERANAARLRQELELQLRESTLLVEIKHRKALALKSELDSLSAQGKSLQRAVDQSASTITSTRDQRIDDLLVQKGVIERTISYLTDQLKIAETLELIKSELAQLASSVKKLRLDIADQEREQESRLNVALSRIKSLTLYILKNDLERQTEFRSGSAVEINFLRDVFLLDGTNNFSASSKVYFKNAVLFAIFFASLELDFFRYPRFVLCDNMEDKGMEKERTQNFQTLITKMSLERSHIPHQIIFTTSMIADNLNVDQYCVGRYYKSGSKSLDLSVPPLPPKITH